MRFREFMIAWSLVFSIVLASLASMILVHNLVHNLVDSGCMAPEKRPVAENTTGG